MNVDEDPLSRVRAKVMAFHEWSHERPFRSARIVQYCGVDLVGACDVPIKEVVSRIEGLLCEGFYVDWYEQDERLYLRVWEFGGPEPDWSKVIAEKPLVEVDDLLRGLG